MNSSPTTIRMIDERISSEPMSGPTVVTLTGSPGPKRSTNAFCSLSKSVPSGIGTAVGTGVAVGELEAAGVGDGVGLGDGVAVGDTDALASVLGAGGRRRDRRLRRQQADRLRADLAGSRRPASRTVASG